MAMKNRPLIARIRAAAAFVLFAACPVLSQEPAKLANDDNGLYQWIATFAFFALICGSAFLNPKRSHLDR